MEKYKNKFKYKVKQINVITSVGIKRIKAEDVKKLVVGEGSHCGKFMYYKKDDYIIVETTIPMLPIGNDILIIINRTHDISILPKEYLE